MGGGTKATQYGVQVLTLPSSGGPIMDVWAPIDPRRRNTAKHCQEGLRKRGGTKRTGNQGK